MTLWYRSPEVLLGTSYATPVDMWAVGCIFAELCMRKPLFQGEFEMDQLTKIFGIMGTPTESEWPENAVVLWSNFKQCPPIDLVEFVPELDNQGRELLEVRIPFFF